MKIPYFKIGEALNEVKDSFAFGSNSEKLSSTAKLLGKSVANIGMLAVEAGIDTVKRAPEHMGNIAQESLDKRSHLMTEKQIDQANSIIEKANLSKENRMKKEVEAERQDRDRE